MGGLLLLYPHYFNQQPATKKNYPMQDPLKLSIFRSPNLHELRMSRAYWFPAKMQVFTWGFYPASRIWRGKTRKVSKIGWHWLVTSSSFVCQWHKRRLRLLMHLLANPIPLRIWVPKMNESDSEAGFLDRCLLQVFMLAGHVSAVCIYR